MKSLMRACFFATVVFCFANQGFSATICPIYGYAFHGTYTSYYAQEWNGTMCVNPQSYDGPNNLTPADCMSSTNCVSVAEKGKGEDPKKVKNHEIHPDIQKDGCKRPLGGFTYDVTVDGTPVETDVTFTDPDGATRRAKLSKGNLNNGFKFYIGHQVSRVTGAEIADKQATWVYTNKKTACNVTYNGNDYQVIVVK